MEKDELRDFLAALVMGVFAFKAGLPATEGVKEYSTQLADISYTVADAMLERREK